MLTNDRLDTDRDKIRQAASGRAVTHVAATSEAANAGHWTKVESRARRLRRQRRMHNAGYHRINGWSVRTW